MGTGLESVEYYQEGMVNSPKLKSLTIEDHLDAQKTREWLQFLSLSFAGDIIQVSLSPADIEALKESKFLAVDLGKVRLLINLADASGDTVYGKGSMQDAPMFFLRALRQAVYRLQQAALWPDDNEIRLHIPQEHFIDFMSTWVKVFSPATPVRQMVEEGVIEIDSIRIPVKTTFGNLISLGRFRAGTSDLVKWVAQFEVQ